MLIFIKKWKFSKFKNLAQFLTTFKTISEEKEIANVFNHFFTNIGTKLDSGIPKSNIMNSPNTYLRNKVEQPLILTPTTPQ